MAQQWSCRGGIIANYKITGVTWGYLRMDYASYFTEFEERPLGEIEGFSREDIKVEYRHHTISWYLDLIHMGELHLDSDFQRRGGVWDAEQKSKFIESLLMHLPITPIFLSQDYDYEYEVLDGLQRLTTINSFITDNGFKLTGLEFYKELEGYRFYDLPQVIQRFIQTSTLPVSVLLPGVDYNLKVSIFHRINTSGVTLNDQEMRVSLHTKSYFYKKLSEISYKYLERLNDLVDKRKKYQELILKTISLHLFGFESYAECRNMKEFLDKSMKVLVSLSENEIDDIFTNYLKGQKSIIKFFGDNNPFDNENGRFTNAIYLSVMLKFLNDDVEKVDVEGFRELIKSDNFKRLVSNGSSKISAISKRDEMLSEVIC